MRAPARERALARFQHQMAAPSPSTRPERVFENGRQVSAQSTRSASQPLSVPTVMQASVPPAMRDRRLPETHHVEGLADRMGAGRAGGRHRIGRALEAEVHGDVARRPRSTISAGLVSGCTRVRVLRRRA